MKNLLYGFLLLLGTGSPSYVFAQSTADYVPSDVSFAVSLHPGHLNKKVNIREFQQMEFYQMIVEEVTRSVPSDQRDRMANALTDMTSIGINDLGDFYIFGKFTAESDYYGLAIPLLDETKFAEFLMGTLPPGERAEDMDGYMYLRPEEDVAIVWNSSVLIFAVADAKENYWDMPYEDDYGYEEYEEYDYEDYPIEEEAPVYEEEEPPAFIEEMPVEEEITEEAPVISDDSEVEEVTIYEIEVEEWEEEEYGTDYEDPWVAYYEGLQAREAMETDAWAKSLINRTFGASIRSNTKYASATAEKSDVNFWLDYNSLLGMMDNGYGYGYPFGGMGMFSTVISSMYNGMYLNAGMNFDDGEVNVDMNLYGNERMLNTWRETYDSKYNKHLTRYIDGNDLLSYLTFNINMEGLGEGLKDFLYPMAASVPGEGETIVAALDVLGIVVDDEALYNLFTGDAVMAVTGVAEFTKTIITYEYDDNFNPTEVEKEVTDYFPEFTIMAGYGNEEHIMRLIRLIETSGMTQNMGTFWSMNIPDVPGEFYLAMEDDILFFSNDTELITERLEDGFPKDRRLGKSHRKQWKKSSSMFFWDIPETLSLVSSFMGTGGPEMEFLNIGKQHFESITVTGSKKVDDSYHSRMTLQMTDEETNAFRQMMELINGFVMDMMGGDSRS